MSDSISWNLQLSVTPGKLEDFRSLMDEMITSTRKEKGCLRYEWYLSGDESACHILEEYVDSSAALEHLGTFGSQFAERFLACVSPTGFSVYGDPSDEVRDVLDGFGAQYLGPFGGF